MEKGEKLGAMTAGLAQKWTSERLDPMSALPPKADIADATRNVRFVPKADIEVLDGTSGNLAPA